MGRDALAYIDAGNALLESGQGEAAIASFDRAIALKPDCAAAHYNRGNALFDLRRFEAAIDSYDKAIAYRPWYSLAYSNRGLALWCLKKHEAAIVSYERAIEIEPNNAEAHNFRGHALRESRRLVAAVASYDRAIAIKGDYAEAYNGRGSALAALDRYEAALESYNQALAIEPGFVEAYLNRGNVFKELEQWHEALLSYDKAIALRPDFAEAYYNRGDAYRGLLRLEAAAASYDRALALQPDLRFLLGVRRHLRMHLCDWRDVDADLAELAARIERGEPASPPFPILALSESATLQRKAAQIWVREECPANPSLGEIPRRGRHEKIRIGYFSADFRDHPVANLTAELFETHDRSRFDITAFSWGPDTKDDIRRRLQGAFDRFIHVRENSDQDVALLARSMELDIAVDLGGFTEDWRGGIFALRAAPLQVSYLGYLGTMGAAYMDYLIADATIVPPAHRPFYEEKILYLPSFQANDSKRRIADKSYGREELGLPPTGFVFCCFNTNYKIMPATFAGWMRILEQVPRSVLLLYMGNPTAENNLRSEAVRRSIDPNRLIFCGRLPMPLYLARYRAADLFLDTLPYNAGTTASDALWAGLPVLTCTGEAFASRVAASLLTAIEMPELITASQKRFEALAVELALDPRRLTELKRRLAEKRLTASLFDTRLFTQHLEAGYARIYERYQAGLPPQHTFSESAS